MKIEASIILPNQLFASSPVLMVDRKIFLVESTRFFSDFRYHKKKLVLHRASMRAYLEKIRGDGYDVEYIPYPDSKTADLLRLIGDDRLGAVHICDPNDHKLRYEFDSIGRKMSLEINYHESPGFITPLNVVLKSLEGKTHYSLTGFYREQRRRLDILMDGSRPVGGRWTFDTENRKRIPADQRVPGLPELDESPHVREASSWVEEHFGGNPGEVDGFKYPVTHADSDSWYRDFLEKRFAHFGDYQDAMAVGHEHLFHSVLTPALNIGLLTPGEVVSEAMEFAREGPVGLNSLEGFIRQVIGWREFIRGIYILEGERQRECNHFGHGGELPPGMYDGTTGILPVDLVVERLLRSAYAHHIERLMVLGNYLMLAETDPDEIYRWFMEMFIDAYDWVMVPNVYGMSQYADGGMMTTKPYICSSNYLRKMGDFPGGQWCEVLDALFWRFVEKHEDFFRANPRMATMAYQLSRMDGERREGHVKIAGDYLRSIGRTHGVNDTDQGT